MKQGEVGREVQAYCNKCKVDTIHIITSVEAGKISRVMCQLCMSYHKYKAPQSQDQKKETKVKRTTTKTKKAASSATKKTATKRRRRTKRKVSWEDLIQTVDEKDAVNYTIDGAYNDGMLLNHKAFGLGVIRTILSETKMEVVFEEGTKILVQNYSE